MTRQPRPVRLTFTAGARQDLRALFEASLQHPRGKEDRLLRVALNELSSIKTGASSTHPLAFMPTYPDLSDCETTYVGTDPNRRPSHRLVWRETEPEDPRELVTREIIVLGPRDNGEVYQVAGSRLGRPVGQSLTELRAAGEPIADQWRDHGSLKSPDTHAGIEGPEYP